MVRPANRTKSIGTKVTEEEYARLQTLAGEVSLSEWVRDVLLGQAEPGGGAGGEAVVLSEVLALRTILLNLFYALSRGERMTAEQMQQVIERADADKLKKAADRLRG